MTLHTLSSTNLLYRHAIVSFILDIIVKFLINTIELIPIPFIVIELNVCFPVAINTPPHAKLRKLFHFIHFLDISMAGLALLFAYLNMLGVVKVNMIR